MSSTFAKPVDSFRTTTVAWRLVGGTEMGLAQSPITGTLPANRILRLTAILNPNTDNEQILTVLEGTQLTTNTISNIVVSVGYNDVQIPPNTTIDIRVCARDIIELQDAINAAEDTLAAHQVVINNIGSGGGGGGTPGGSPNTLQYNNGTGGFAGSDLLSWDESTSTLNVEGTIFSNFSGDGTNIDGVHLVSGNTTINEGYNYLIFFQDNDTLTQEPDFRYNNYETNLIIGTQSHQGRITISSDDTVGNRGLVLSNRTNHIDITLQALMPDGFVVHDGSGIPASTSVGPLKVTLGYYQSIGIMVTLVDQQDADAFQVLAADKTTVLAAIDKDGKYCSGTRPLMLRSPANGSETYTPENAGIFMYNASGAEILRIVTSDPDDSNYNTGNLYIGLYTGFSQPTDSGYYNIGIGTDTLYNLTNGNYNVGVGHQALYSLIDGENNEAFGYQALYSATDSYGNSAFGDGALTTLISDGENTAVGYSALADLEGGYSNTGIGFSALRNIADGQENTVLGYRGGTKLIGGNNNVFVGAESCAGFGTVTLNNAIAIGYQTTISASNRAVIGNNAITDVFFGSESRLASIYANKYVGGDRIFKGLSSVSTDRDLGYVHTGFSINTDASYKGYISLCAQDFNLISGGREGIRIGTDGTQVLLGFYGAPVTAKAPAPTTLTDVINILRALGFCL